MVLPTVKQSGEHERYPFSGSRSSSTAMLLYLDCRAAFLALLMTWVNPPQTLYSDKYEGAAAFLPLVKLLQTTH